MEWAMGSFQGLLFGEGLVSSSLIVLPGVPHKEPLPRSEAEKLIQEASHPNIALKDRKAIIDRLHEDENLKGQFKEITKSYIAQATPEVEGEFLTDFLKRAFFDPSLFDELDKDQIQELILSSMLTNPADAKGDNFIVTKLNSEGKRKIMSIDNDLSLASEIIMAQPGYHYLEAKSLLFAVPQFMSMALRE